MAKGISISVASDTRDFLRGVKSGVLEPLEDVSDALKDVERESDTAGSALEDAMRDGQRKTEDAADEVKDLKDALRDAERNAKDLGRAGKDAGDDTRDGMRRAEEGVEEFRDEANSTAREAAASFDGSAESIGDAFQEIAANAFVGFGPAGAVAGLAAAGGIGLATAAFTAHDEAMELSRERTAEWAQAYIEAGSSRLTMAQLISRTESILTDSTAMQEARDNAAEWGVSVNTAVAAMAGDVAAFEDVQAGLLERQQELADFSQNPDNLPYGLFQQQLQDMSVDVRNGEEALTALQSEMEGGADAAAIFSEYLRTAALTTEGATVAVNEFGDSVYTLPDGAQIIIDAETGQASTDIGNVAFQTNQLDGQSATVTATAVVAQAESILANLVRNRSATITAHIRDQRGVSIPV